MTTFPSTLTTDRLVAEVCSVERDLDGFAAICADRELGEMMWPGELGGARTHEQSAAWLAKYEAHWDAVGFGPWTVRERDGGELVGHLGLSYTVVAGRAEVEVGWVVARRHWNRGIATEVTAAALAHANAIRGLESVVAFALTDHARAIRVIERCGFTFERPTTVIGLPHVLYRKGVARGPTGPGD